MHAARASLLLPVVAAAAIGCGAETAVVLTVHGPAPGAKTLLMKLVGAEGALPDLVTIEPLELPVEIVIPRPGGTRIGAIVWIEDEAPRPVAQARTELCMLATANVRARYDVLLGPVPEGWTADAAGCSCDLPGARMCPGGAVMTPAPVPGPGPVERPDAAVAPGIDAAGVADASGDRTMVASGNERPPTPDAAPATPDTAPAMPAPPAAGEVRVPNALFGFEMAAPDWTSSEAMPMRDTAMVTQGQASLAFTAAGKVNIRSRAFDTTELTGVTGKLSLDVWMEKMQGHEASLQLWFECREANVYNGYIEYKGLAPLAPGMWNSLVFKLPGPIQTAMSGQHKGCKIWMEHSGQGPFRYDRLGFSP